MTRRLACFLVHDTAAFTKFAAPGAGAGGVWATINEIPGGAVGQSHPLGCIEMLDGTRQGSFTANSAQGVAMELGGARRAGYVVPE